MPAGLLARGFRWGWPTCAWPAFSPRKGQWHVGPGSPPTVARAAALRQVAPPVAFPFQPLRATCI